MLKSKTNEPLNVQIEVKWSTWGFGWRFFPFLDKPAPVHRFCFSSVNNSAADSWSSASASLICSWEAVFSWKFGRHFHFSSLKDPSPSPPEVTRFCHLRQMALVPTQPGGAQHQALASPFDLTLLSYISAQQVKAAVTFPFLLPKNHNSLSLHPRRYFWTFLRM